MPHDHSVINSHHAHSEGLVDMLELDAATTGAYLDEIPAWIADRVECAPELIVDLGAGTGAGSTALARRFATASIRAVDASTAMLDHVAQRAEERGLASRIRTVLCDLDDGWPDAVTGADLVWASSSLHEVADPDRVLRDARDALRPGGLLAVIEMDVLPSFLPHDYPASAPGLEQRAHDALARLGWNAHGDWAHTIENAGLELIGRKTVTAESRGPATLAYARAWLTRLAAALPGHVDARDIDALETLLSDDAELRRVATTVRGSRTAVLARRPEDPSPHTRSAPRAAHDVTHEGEDLD
ncbi:class I SAM-dependent methyltransferase [Paramicrobacterium agarici]|uniref:class I SAM-dependent methyltransferase n=1 Tax=Paramicrobacterium agarici TaxID=630514 RepID=UPI001151F94A|nr:class I SAM-dependent methyltransferase [Microbacterium agarici]TQO22786.1 methyltransferase family protein [Microbacterium agarici]